MIKTSLTIRDDQLVTARGLVPSRNAIIATSVAIGGGAELNLMPARFPAMFGEAVAVAMADAERRLSGRPPASLPAS